jgi:hypothetical protein
MPANSRAPTPWKASIDTEQPGRLEDVETGGTALLGAQSLRLFQRAVALETARKAG